MNYIVTFFTHADGIRFDRFLKSKSIKGFLRPTPRILSSSCGICIFFESSDHPDIIKDSLFINGCDKIFIYKDGKYTLIAKECE